MKTTLFLILTPFTIATLTFVPNSIAQDNSPEYVVRAIYFFPNDLQPHPDIDAILDYFMKDFQRHFADRMEFHGFGRKTFRFEADENGNAIVHQVKGNFNDTYYSGETYSKVLGEFTSRFGNSKNIDFFVIDTRNPLGFLPSGEEGHPCGIGYGDSDSGYAIVPAYGDCFGGQLPGTVNEIHDFIRAFGIHELLHAFGMLHDRSGPNTLDLTFCAAEWLDGHRYFNPDQDNVVNHNATIQMLRPTLSPPTTIRLRFEITDPDGLHQAQLIRSYDPIIACQKVSGKSATVVFETTELFGVSTIHLQIMDAYGNFRLGGQQFPIDPTNLLPSPEAISIPDPILRTALHRSLNLASDETITQLNILNLRYFDISGNQNIKDLAGLEYASNLRSLFIAADQIQNITPITALKNLHNLVIERGRQIQDITPITALKNLGFLAVVGGQIKDITPFAQFTHLSQLNLLSNQISDITPLAELTNLRWLQLGHNNISDLSPLVANTGLGSGDKIDVRGNPLNYLSIMAHIPALQRKGVTVEFDDTAAKPPDVNGDGSVNVLDLILIASKLGNEGTNIAADIDGDGVVDILDLVLVVGMFEEAAAAPSAQPQVPETLTAVEVQGWLTDARALEVRDPIMKRGIMMLEQLLISLTPTETELLANYPNPFNPETWIPYRLAEDAFVTLTIYDGAGQVVRTLDVGHQIAAIYENRSKAIYWDGRNNFGETVASGLYFYHLSAGDYSATRKMVILK